MTTGHHAAPDCLFCRMASGAMEVTPLLENDALFAIRDISPRAPVHVLVIPRDHIPDARSLTTTQGQLLSRLFAAAAEVAKIEGVSDSGFRLAFNVGDDAGMTIPHLHLHLMGGHRLGPEG